MFAYIPARSGSKRIPRKNIRPLGGKPLLTHVLDRLAQVKGLTGIGVSSEDSEILAIANAHPVAKTLGPRDTVLADDTASFLDLALKDVPRFAKAFKDDAVLFVTATAALVPALAYERALALHRAAPNALIMAVTRYAISPFLALSGHPEEGLQPLFPKMYLKPTKDLPGAFVDCGCFYGFRLTQLEGKTKFIDIHPIFGAVLPSGVGIDLDTEEDWRRLEKAFIDGLTGGAPI